MPFEDGRRGSRLHPLSPVFEVARSAVGLLVSALVVLFLASGGREEAWTLVFLVPVFLHRVFRFLTLRYVVTDDHLVLREGFVFRKTRHIPLDRIQNVDTVQNPVHRFFGVAEVRLETAGGSEPEAVLRVLSTAALERVRAGIFRDREPSALQPIEQQEVQAREPSFFRMGVRDIVYFGLLSQKGLALLGGALYLLYELDLGERLAEILDPEKLSWRPPVWLIVLLGLGFLFLLQVFTVLWAVLTLYGFQVTRVKEDLRTVCGLWTRQSATLPRERIQSLSIEASAPKRLLGRLGMRVRTAGGDSTEDSQVSRKWLVPLVRRGELPRILAEIQPELDLEAVEWSGVHPRAVRRLSVKLLLLTLLVALLLFRIHPAIGGAFLAVGLPAAWFLARARVRRLGYALTRSAVLVRDGLWTHVVQAVRHKKIQSIRVVETPFDRRHGMASLRIDTAGGGQSVARFRVPYLDRREALRLLEELRGRAARHDFRW